MPTPGREYDTSHDGFKMEERESLPAPKVREKSSFSENATSLQCISTLRAEIEKKEKEAQESNAQWLKKFQGRVEKS